MNGKGSKHILHTPCTRTGNRKSACCSSALDLAQKEEEEDAGQKGGG